MRTISATLLAQQNAASNTPYIHLLFTSKDGTTTYDYSSDQADRRILSIDHSENPYDEDATIILRNNDRTIPDLRGYWTEIGYGYVTGSGNEYSSTARMWVKYQQTVSAGGRLYDVLELEGMWRRLKEHMMMLGSAPYFPTEGHEAEFEYTGYTIIEIIASILLDVEPYFSVEALGSSNDDGIMDTLPPDFLVNQQGFESAGGLIGRLMRMTKSYLRSVSGKHFQVVYPQSTDAIQITYHSDMAPYFYEYVERKNVRTPNHVYAVGNAGEDGLWTATTPVVGEAEDTAATAIYYDVPEIVLARDITSQTDINTRAAVVLARSRMESLAGKLTAPHDCQVELYDRIAIIDTRAQ